MNVRGMLGECQVNVKSQSELDIGGRETCIYLKDQGCGYNDVEIHQKNELKGKLFGFKKTCV